MNAKIVKTYTLVDEKGEWLDTCLSEEDAVKVAKSQNLKVRNQNPSSVWKDFLSIFSREPL